MSEEQVDRSGEAQNMMLLGDRGVGKGGDLGLGGDCREVQELRSAGDVIGGDNIFSVDLTRREKCMEHTSSVADITQDARKS